MKTLLAGLALSFMITGASASTISVAKVSTVIDPVVAQADIVQPTSATGGFIANATGSIGGVRRSPYDTIAGLAATGKYNSVQGGGTATYQFTAAQTGLSILWGSPESFNTLAFFLAGTQVDLGVLAGVSGMAITGAEVAALPLAQPEDVGVPQVVFSGFLFDRAVLSSQSNAFEHVLLATIPAPVPLPAPAVLLLASVGALGLMRRRMRA